MLGTVGVRRPRPGAKPEEERTQGAECSHSPGPEREAGGKTPWNPYLGRNPCLELSSNIGTLCLGRGFEE